MRRGHHESRPTGLSVLIRMRDVAVNSKTRDDHDPVQPTDPTRRRWVFPLLGALALTSLLVGSLLAVSMAAAPTGTRPRPQPEHTESPAIFVSTSTAECPSSGGCSGPTLAPGMTLAVTFNRPPSVASTFSLTLTDGSDQGTVDSSENATATVAGSTVTITLTKAPAMSAGSGLSLSRLEILAETGVTAGADGVAWNLLASGEVDKADVTASTTCAPINSRVFGGTNCSIGFGAPGPTPPDVYDVIATPTQDLVGPPYDSAPEVITDCQAGSTDTVYDLDSEALLGSDPCGTYVSGEHLLGNTTSNTLDYIPTSGLESFEQVGVVEQVPGSRYVSATVVPPQVISITVSGPRARLTFNNPVICQSPRASQTVSQFTYTSPWWSKTLGDLVYPTSIRCSSRSGASTLTVTYHNDIPTGRVRFKVEGYGAGYFVVGAPGSPMAGERVASQSAYSGGPHHAK
jgi:hypothetical protein